MPIKHELFLDAADGFILRLSTCAHVGEGGRTVKEGAMIKRILITVVQRRRFGQQLLAIHAAPGIRLLPKGFLFMKDHDHLSRAPDPQSPNYAAAAADIAAKLLGIPAGELPPLSPVFLRRPCHWQQIVMAKAHAASLRLLARHSTHASSEGG